MSERARTARRTRRRDNDPVRAYPDGRVAYWTGGVPGLGTRKFDRGSSETVEERAAAIRAMLLEGRGVVANRHATLYDVAKKMIATLRDTVPDGSLDAYRRDLNHHILPVIGGVACAETGLWCFTAVLDEAVAKGLAENSVKGVARTLGTLATFGAERGFFGDRPPFGSERQVRAAKKKAFGRARGDPITTQPLTTAAVPAWDDVERLAAAFERHYPRRGAAVVRVMAASGIRPAEFLALSTDDVDLDTMQIDVHWQLKRTGDWPARRPTKNRRRRRVAVWLVARPDLTRLVEQADDGWLVPPVTGTQHKWLASFDKLMEQARKDCGWQWVLYDLRHHFASWSLQAVAAGGHGYSLETVSRWLGHADATITARTYWHPTGSEDTDRTRTQRPPGTTRRRR